MSVGFGGVGGAGGAMPLPPEDEGVEQPEAPTPAAADPRSRPLTGRRPSLMDVRAGMAQRALQPALRDALRTFEGSRAHVNWRLSHAARQERPSPSDKPEPPVVRPMYGLPVPGPLPDADDITPPRPEPPVVRPMYGLPVPGPRPRPEPGDVTPPRPAPHPAPRPEPPVVRAIYGLPMPGPRPRPAPDDVTPPEPRPEPPVVRPMYGLPMPGVGDDDATLDPEPPPIRALYGVAMPPRSGPDAPLTGVRPRRRDH